MDEAESSPLLPSNTTTSIATPSTHNTHTIPIPNSQRTLSYATYGSQSPTAPTILYLHGYPSSRLEASLLHHLALSHHPPIRIIAPDRPGFGGTSPHHPHRTIASYAHTDILPLIHHLHLHHFSLLGLSGGGPYALACTLHPHLAARLGAVGIACGAPHWAAQGAEGWRMLPWWSKLGWHAAWYAPLLFRGILGSSIAFVRWLAGRQWVQRRADKALVAAREKRAKAVSEGTLEEGVKGEVERVMYSALGEDQDGWDAAEQREYLLSQVFEPFTQGTAAALEEFKLFCTDEGWGFGLGDVTWRGKEGERVVMWHGTQDVNAPIEGARFMAGQVGADLREYEGTHGEVVSRFEEILRELAKPLLVEQRSKNSEGEA